MIVFWRPFPTFSEDFKGSFNWESYTAEETWSTACSWHEIQITSPVFIFRIFGRFTLKCAQWLCIKAWLNHSWRNLGSSTTSFLELSAFQLQEVEQISFAWICGFSWWKPQEYRRGRKKEDRNRWVAGLAQEPTGDVRKKRYIYLQGRRAALMMSDDEIGWVGNGLSVRKLWIPDYTGWVSKLIYSIFWPA